MQSQEKFFLLTIFLAVLLIYNGLNKQFNIDRNLAAINPFNSSEPKCPVIKDIEFTATDNTGKYDENLTNNHNYIIIFDPKSPNLDFKVNLGLSHKLYAQDSQGNFRQDYQPKLFRELIADENSTLDGRRPIAAINGDYIDKSNKPQGFNVSRGVEYSGSFKGKRSSFSISGGKPEKRKAIIQLGNRKDVLLNYNVVGGNGRFYKNGKFENICPALGDYICGKETSRSLVAITSKGYVILLVNDANLKYALYPSMFDDVLEGIAANYCLGKIQEGMLFDNGYSTGLYFDNNVYVNPTHPVGSVFLIYKK